MAKMGYPRLYGTAKCTSESTGRAWFAITCNGELWNVETDSGDNPKEYPTREAALADLDKYVPLTPKG